MAYEMVKLTGEESLSQLRDLLEQTNESIATLQSYIDTRIDYRKKLEKELAVWEELRISHEKKMEIDALL